MDEVAIRKLRQAPGVGPRTAEDLIQLDVRSLDDLSRSDPYELYDRLCDRAGTRLDRCVLYAFRCAAYFASHETHDPELLKWWNWKDRP
jgi:hypothetical protein